MFWTIIGVIVSIGCFIGIAGINGYNSDTTSGFEIKASNLMALIPLIIFIIIGCVKTVPTGSTGVVTTFGKIENHTLEAGVHFMNPFSKVIKMDNRTQIASLDMSCFSSDIQEVTLKYTINYQIDASNAQEIYRTIGKDYFDIVVQPKALEAVKGVFAKYNAETLVSSRNKLSSEIELVLIDSLQGYNINVTATSLENIDFTDAFTNAVEAKQVAEQNKLKAKTEQEQATMEAEQKAERDKIQAAAAAEVAKTKANSDAEVAKIAAEADLEVQKINADAAEYTGQKEAAKNKVLSENLNDSLLRYYYIQQWNGNLPNTMLDSSSGILLNMDTKD